MSPAREQNPAYDYQISCANCATFETSIIITFPIVVLGAAVVIAVSTQQSLLTTDGFGVAEMK